MKKTITLNISSEMHTTVTDGKVMLKYTYPTSGYDFKPLLTWSFPFPPILGLKGGGKSPIRRYAEIRK